MDTTLFKVDKEFPIYSLDCKDSFTNLTPEEKHYAVSLIKAGWAGALIDLIQCSPESAGLFLLAQNIFRDKKEAELKGLVIDTLKLSEEDYDDFLNYFVMVYDNLGNYKSFGDSKFIPRLDAAKFDVIMTNLLASKDENVKNTYKIIKNAIFELTSRNAQMGLGSEGVSTYYSYNCSTEDAQLVQRCLDANNVSAYNTRVFKTQESDGKTVYTIRQASSERSVQRVLPLESGVQNVEMRLVNGDYAELMDLMVKELTVTETLALNSNEKKMLEKYIESFRVGSIDAHKDGSRWWIRDKGPVVENYIGFIETYRDPIGVRGEFEAFIAVVNKLMTQKFNKLVSGAETILKELPWPNEYEKDKFLQPDFTSLDIINFPNSGMPVGINIPNYDDIRQDEGFKNVSLGNVLKARFKDPKANFLRQEDKEVFIAKIAESFEIQVGLHELIGHGSGKLFYHKDGKFNFNSQQTKDLKSGGDITSWYKDSETWDGKFQSIASPFEECRAECVGLYLCSLPHVLSIFGHEHTTASPETVSDVVYVNWLSMIKSAVVSMEFYTPEQRKWRQAHCQARFVILQVLLEVAGLVELREITGDNGRPDITIHLNRDLIIKKGRPAIGNFLKMLQYYKSTANVEEGTAFFTKFSVMNEHFLHLRSIVLSRKLPRGCTIQSTIDSELALHEYEPSKWGMLQSFQHRFEGAHGRDVERALSDVWSRDHAHFEY